MKINIVQSIAIVVLASLALTAVLLYAENDRADGIYPTLPGTSIRDYSKPGYTVQGNTMYQTLPGTGIRDYSAPGYTVQGGTMYQTLPGTNIRDYNKPGYQIRH